MPPALTEAGEVCTVSRSAISNSTGVRQSMPIFAMAAVVIASLAAMPGNVLPVMAGKLSDFHSLDEVELGLLIASGTLTGLLTSLAAPYWIGRVNLRYAVAIALALDATGLLGLRFAPGVAALFAAQALAGASGIVVASVCLTVIAKLPNPTRAYGIKVTTDVVFAGTFLALMPAMRLELGGFVAVLAAICIMAAPLALKLPVRSEFDYRSTDGSPVRLRDAPWSAWLGLLTIVVFYVGGIGVWAFLERIAVHAGIERGAVSNAIAVGLFVGVIGSLGAAILAGRTQRIWPETLSGVVLVASFAMLAFIDGTVQFYVAVFVFNASWNFFIPFVIGLVAGRDSTGRMSSLIPGTVMIGGVLGPVLAGAMIRASGYRTAMVVMTLIVATSIAGYVLIARTPIRRPMLERRGEADRK
jgi:predicted MFS family arabinose efflux permease